MKIICISIAVTIFIFVFFLCVAAKDTKREEDIREFELKKERSKK